VIRDLERLVFDGAPVPDWEGETLQQVLRAPAALHAGVTPTAARSDAERKAFAACETPAATTRISCCS
jgi:hypothetical protein